MIEIFDHAEELTTIGLDLPFPIKINQMLGYQTSFLTYEGAGGSTMTIRFDNVSYTYQKGTPYQHQAIHDVNTEFEQGKYYAIVGQTGSGKSTLIQNINALLKPTTGTVTVDDITITHKTKDKYMNL